MSFTTRCPACGTTFKIVPDQLKISDGWVRCGHCADVFDATLFLEGEGPVAVPVAPVPPAPVQETEPVVSAPTRRVVISAPVTPPPGDGDDGWLLRPRQTEEPAPSLQGPRSVPGMDRVQADQAFEEELRRFAVSSTSGATPPVPSPAPAAPAAIGPVAAETAPFEEDEAVAVDLRPALPLPTFSSEPEGAHPAEPPVLEPSFVVQARKRAFWQSRGTRAALWLVSVLLVLGLLIQIAVHERDRLAAWHPATGSLLVALCRPLGCEVGPARQIESVVIDSSNLVRRLGNSYSFDLVLKNSAAHPVAMPALELSLTDTRDAVIVRRVFPPEELPGAPRLLPPQGALSLSLRLSIADQGVSSMSGYRALVFYP